MIKFIHMKADILYTQIKAAIAKEPKILATYVIGSTAFGKTTTESDFDLVVVTYNRKTLDYKKVYKLIKDIKFPKTLDLSIVDKSSSPIFLYEIIAKGKKIYQKNKLQINDFEAFVLHNYYDTAHFRSIFEKQLKQKIFSYAN